MPEQIIKLWKEAGFEIISCTKKRFEVYKQWIHRNHYESAKVVIEKDLFFIIGQFSNEYTQLLIKTLMTLGKEV